MGTLTSSSPTEGPCTSLRSGIQREPIADQHHCRFTRSATGQAHVEKRSMPPLKHEITRRCALTTCHRATTVSLDNPALPTIELGTMWTGRARCVRAGIRPILHWRTIQPLTGQVAASTESVTTPGGQRLNLSAVAAATRANGSRLQRFGMSGSSPTVRSVLANRRFACWGPPSGTWHPPSPCASRERVLGHRSNGWNNMPKNHATTWH